MICLAYAVAAVPHMPVTQTLPSYPGNHTNHCCLCQAVRFPDSKGGEMQGKKETVSRLVEKKGSVFVCLLFCVQSIQPLFLYKAVSTPSTADT